MRDIDTVAGNIQKTPVPDEKCDLVDRRSNERLSKKVTDIPLTVYCAVCGKLNRKYEELGDYRLLAEKLNYSSDLIMNLEQNTLKTNPTHKLFNMWCRDFGSEATVGRLLEMFKGKDLMRDDVVDLLNTCTESTKVNELPYTIYTEMCLKLNILDEESHKDFRMLGEKMGYKRDDIISLDQGISTKNPTDELLLMWCRDSGSEATVAKFIELLKEEDLGRKDVAEILEQWVLNGELK